MDNLPEDWTFFTTPLETTVTGLSQTIFVCDAPLFPIPSMVVIQSTAIEVLSFEQIETTPGSLRQWFRKNKQTLIDHWNQKTSSVELFDNLVAI